MLFSRSELCTIVIVLSKLSWKRFLIQTSPNSLKIQNPHIFSWIIIFHTLWQTVLNFWWVNKYLNLLLFLSVSCQLTTTMIHVYFSILLCPLFLDATLIAALLQSYIFFSYSFRDSALVKINITKYSNLPAKGYGIIIWEKIYGSCVFNSWITYFLIFAQIYDF